MKKSILKQKLRSQTPLQHGRKKPNLSFLQNFILLILTVLCTQLFAQTPASWSNGQCAVNCNDHLNISLNPDGTALIEPFLVWENGAGDVCWNGLDSVVVVVEGGTPIVNPGPGSILSPGTPVSIPYTSSVLDCAVAGQVVGYNLLFYFTGGLENSCWGTLLLEDKNAPVLECFDDMVYCNEDIYAVNYNDISVTDNCDTDVELSYEEEFIDLDCTTFIPGSYLTGKVERIWTATDDFGNSSTCSQTIYVKKATLEDIDLPEDVDLSCEQDGTDLELTGQPLINGLPVNASDLCDIGVTFTDQTFPICGGGLKILRTWTIIDWCPIYEGTTGTGSLTHIQFIKLRDETAPEINCPDDFTVGTDQLHCGAIVELPEATVSDNCSAFTVETITPVGTIDGNGGFTPDLLGLGSHIITYIATDVCGNTSACTVEVTVIDDDAPIAICDEHTVIALDNEGTGQVCWGSLDDLSYDNCAIVEYSIRRMDASAGTPFTECVNFTCDDVGESLTVILKVEDAAGNENTCMVIVDVQDKLDPIIACPADVELECRDDYEDLAATGEATAIDNCGTPLITYADSVAIDNCGTGEVIRTWTATAINGVTASCEQIISIVNSTPFNSSDITWPENYEATTCGEGLNPDQLPAGYDRPVVVETTCDLISVTYVDEVLPVTPPACLKILRTWTVVDWCQFNPNGELVTGRWERVQIIKVNNSQEPVIVSDCTDKDFCSFEEDCGAAPIELFINATDDCTNSIDLNYHYVIDLNSDGTDDLTGYSSDASGAYPLGTHSITWEVEDGCGNIATCTYSFKISDCKKPSPVCINGLVSVLMPGTGEITIWASDFESASSFDNCTAYEDLQFSFSEDILDISKTYTCDQLGTQILQLWATDETGNQDYCSTYIIIQDNNQVCFTTELAAISGEIATENHDMIEHVDVEVTGSNALPFTTSAEGSFAFPGLPTGDNYSVAPGKNMHASNGVTTFDLVLISKHILGLQTLDSPYKIIAADANASGSVTTLDMVQIRRLILNIDDAFANNQSWRFVDANFVFPDEDNPFSTVFSEVYNINDFSGDEQINFVGIKIGDVNSSAAANSYMMTSERTKDGILQLNTMNKKMHAGELVEIALTAANFEDIAGFQFTLNFDEEKLEFNEILPGVLSDLNITNFGLNDIEDGVLTTSWNTAKGINIAKDEPLFILQFKAVATGELKDMLSVNSSVTVAEAYTTTARSDVQLSFLTKDGTQLAATFELYQNKPNPFENETTIGFNLEFADQISLDIFDVSGKQLKSVKGKYSQGYHEVQISRAELPARGILYYQLNTSHGTATKKMIMVN